MTVLCGEVTNAGTPCRARVGVGEETCAGHRPTKAIIVLQPHSYDHPKLSPDGEWWSHLFWHPGKTERRDRRNRPHPQGRYMAAILCRWRECEFHALVDPVLVARWEGL